MFLVELVGQWWGGVGWGTGLLVRASWLILSTPQMAGNPDQQEDTIDDQYQEEGGDVCDCRVYQRL